MPLYSFDNTHPVNFYTVLRSYFRCFINTKTDVLTIMAHVSTKRHFREMFEVWFQCLNYHVIFNSSFLIISRVYIIFALLQKTALLSKLV